MPRVVSLFLPSWPTDRLRRKLGETAPSADTPLVLIGREGGRRVVLAADDAGRAAGLHVGMPVTKARILVPGLVSGTTMPVRTPRRWSDWRSGCCSEWPRLSPSIRRTASSSTPLAPSIFTAASRRCWRRCSVGSSCPA